MKKLLCAAITLFSTTALASCAPSKAPYVFTPTLDAQTKCSIKVGGNYDNFEALEAEFDRFNKYYPKVELSYSKIDKYQDNIATVLNSSDKPNIFFSFTWMNGDPKYQPVLDHMEKLSDPALNMNLDCVRSSLMSRDSKGDVYMVPMFSRSYGTLVNKNLFSKENIKIPTTWNELLSACAAFKEKGYKNPMMGYSKDSSSCLMNTIAYPSFVATLAKNPTALALANDLDPAAGVYMREALEKVDELIKRAPIDLSECDQIGDNYTKVILRFFEGDVPMMICAADTVSGTKKREEKSDAFVANPFDYAYYPIPLTDQGGYFIDSPSVEFSVNKDCDNLDMTNEFMRFLVTDQELNVMASAKRLVAPTKDISFDPVYAPFSQIPAERTFSPEVIGIKDPLAVQLRLAAFKVGKGQLTIDEAIAQYGSLK